MKTHMKFLAIAATVALATGSVCAQTAGTWMVRAGATTLTPSGPSACMTAPDFGDTTTGCTKSNVSADTQLAGGITYMLTDNISVDVPVALPFTHKISGAGSMQGSGNIGEVQALPITVFLQYRFLEANAKFRPYVGLGATYAYFFNPQGSGRLTATTNPGGTPTTFTVDSKFILTPQIGATLTLSDKWFLDVFYSQSKLSTTTHLSSGQTMDANLDPVAYGIAVGYKF
ncbi:MAG: OmpW family outer membrane protein [Rhodoferax sp.]|uniref:OmpW/AlkL family protein n=1 Tax=Rhodoferax sp. TaxID=50421 RepID=UPI003015CA9C